MNEATTMKDAKEVLGEAQAISLVAQYAVFIARSAKYKQLNPDQPILAQVILADMQKTSCVLHVDLLMPLVADRLIALEKELREKGVEVGNMIGEVDAEVDKQFSSKH